MKTNKPNKRRFKYSRSLNKNANFTREFLQNSIKIPNSEDNFIKLMIKTCLVAPRRHQHGRLTESTPPTWSFIMLSSFAVFLSRKAFDVNEIKGNTCRIESFSSAELKAQNIVDFNVVVWGYVEKWSKESENKIYVHLSLIYFHKTVCVLSVPHRKTHWTPENNTEFSIRTWFQRDYLRKLWLSLVASPKWINRRTSKVKFLGKV